MRDRLTQNIITMGDETAYLSVKSPGEKPMEDRLAVAAGQSGLRACIADGHWGDGTAQLLVDYWMDQPMSGSEALEATYRIQKTLYDQYGNPLMDSDRDRTPEAAFIAIDLQDSYLSYVAYGDCQLLVAHNGLATFQTRRNPTWLGAFSYLGLRQRLPVSQALQYGRLKLPPESYVVMFTDGLDEWDHNEQTSLSVDEIAANFDTQSARELTETLGRLAHNTLDDVSLLVHKQ